MMTQCTPVEEPASKRMSEKKSAVPEHTDLRLSVCVLHDGGWSWFSHAMTHHSWSKDTGKIVLVHLTVWTLHHPQ